MKNFLGVARSLLIYHRPSHIGRMVEFYRPFVNEGAIVFDIGAHVGDRTRAFLRLGCRVLAVEPQPRLARLLKMMFLANPLVTIAAAAVSDGQPRLKLHINSRNPTLSTASADFIDAANTGVPGWEGQRWDREIEVPATTLDALIRDHGRPAFVKIDVEGYEDRVLAGLSHALPALSFEFTTLQKQIALASLERLRSLGTYRFNACLGESWTEVFDSPRSEDEIAEWLVRLPHKANSGDIYCRLEGRR